MSWICVAFCVVSLILWLIGASLPEESKRDQRSLEGPTFLPEDVGELSPRALAGGACVDLDGESRYQQELDEIASGRTDGTHRYSTTATLVGVARVGKVNGGIAVFIEGRRVGELPLGAAREFRELLEAMQSRGEVATCKATIVGGKLMESGWRTSFGVQLDLVHPDRVPTESRIIAKAKREIEGRKSPEGRRSALRDSLRLLWTDESRHLLLAEASRIEVEHTIQGAGLLRTKAGKKRRLEDALAALKADEVPDELQQEQVKWLEDALRELDAPAEGKMTS